MPRALVVGASGGIGSACADRLELDGFQVVRASRNGSMKMDVTSQPSVESALGFAWPLDALVCAWGAAPLIAPSCEVAPEDFARVINTDVVGAFRVCRQAGKYMCAQGHGRIVLLSSIHAISTYPMRAAYAAAKAGVVGLAKALAIEWGEFGVTVNCVLPGQVQSPRSDKLNLPIDKIMARSPTRKIPNCPDVAGAVSFLCGPDSEHVNGHSLVVDGGWLHDAYWNH